MRVPLIHTDGNDDRLQDSVVVAAVTGLSRANQNSVFECCTTRVHHDNCTAPHPQDTRSQSIKVTDGTEHTATWQGLPCSALSLHSPAGTSIPKIWQTRCYTSSSVSQLDEVFSASGCCITQNVPACLHKRSLPSWLRHRLTAGD